jgi:hypothetical protein
LSGGGGDVIIRIELRGWAFWGELRAALGIASRVPNKQV